MKHGFKNRGLTLVEMIVYIAVLILLTTAIVNSIVSLSLTYRQFKVAKRVGQSAMLAMERISREIRNADSVDTAQSLLDAHPGALQLNATTPGGTARIVKFYLEDGTLKVSENGVAQGPLISSRASTTNLVFRLIPTPNSEAVKIEMTITATSSSYSKTEKFYDTIILRGSY